jgi:hypothetical protein
MRDIETVENMSVTKISLHKNRATTRDALKILEELKRLAEEGKMSGFAYIVEIEADPLPRFGVLGQYLSDPFRALSACNRLWLKLGRIASIKDAERAQQR